MEALRQGGRDAHSEPMSEVRALLTELSRSRARQGFTPSETALGILTLKQCSPPSLDRFRELVLKAPADPELLCDHLLTTSGENKEDDMAIVTATLS